MPKEQIYIVLSHLNSLNKGKWETKETVEFVNNLKNRHIQESTAIGDYINRTMISGTRYGITEYSQFEEYIRTKYRSQLDQLNSAYSHLRVDAETPEDNRLVKDQFGNIRERTIFDIR